MSHSIQNSSVIQELEDQGIKYEAGRKVVSFHGKNYTKVSLRDREEGEKAGKFERVGRGFAAAGVAVMTLGTAFFSKAVRHALIDIPLKGYAEEKVLTGPGVDPLDELRDPDKNAPEQEGSKNSLIERRGYDPKMRKTIADYLERPVDPLKPDGDKWYTRMYRTRAGDLVLPVKLKGETACIMVSKDDWEHKDWSNVEYYRFSKAKSGKPLTDAELERAIETWSAQKEELEEGLVKKIEERAQTLGRMNHWNKEKIEAEKENLIKAIKAEIGLYVLDYKGKRTRVYSRNLDPSKFNILTGMRSVFSGTCVAWSESVSETVDSIFRGGKNKKTKPMGEKPFAQASPAA